MLKEVNTSLIKINIIVKENFATCKLYQFDCVLRASRTTGFGSREKSETELFIYANSITKAEEKNDY